MTSLGKIRRKTKVKALATMANALTQEVSNDSSNPIKISLGCERLENSEFIRLYLAVCRIQELFKDDTWSEPRFLAASLLEAVEKERLKRGVEVK